ncbi:hypothetical protein Ahy_B04g069159 [Arachis hypogaea]|uniref:MATE efflux family protein n=1 Tax=Arachis hypogaea TaxID=3818 RepID=A0A444ZBV1_ARAHY|nr:hypothetical protein Ahy_B04g069159 [Arachis hypogaea]
MVLLSGRLPNPNVNTSLTIWMIPFGLSGAISTRVSNELGAGNPWSARLAVHVVVVAAIIEGILVATLMIIIRNVWGHVYSNNVQVVRQSMEGEYKNNTGVSVEPNVSKQNKLRSVVKEVRKQIYLAGPLIMVNLLNFAIELIFTMDFGLELYVPLSFKQG